MVGIRVAYALLGNNQQDTTIALWVGVEWDGDTLARRRGGSCLLERAPPTVGLTGLRFERTHAVVSTLDKSQRESRIHTSEDREEPVVSDSNRKWETRLSHEAASKPC